MIKRRAEGDRVADRADDQSFFVAEIGELGAERTRRFHRRLGRLVGDEFQRADQADAARLADERVIGETLQPRLELRRQPARRADADLAPRRCRGFPARPQWRRDGRSR